MSAIVSWLLLAAAAPHGGDAVVACRQAHASDPAAHIACLERALQGHLAAIAAEPPAKAPGLGAEQVDKRLGTDRTGPVTVQIVKVIYPADGAGVFHMADGQVWRETERTPEFQRLRADRQYGARIERGKVRGYRMFVDGVRRMIKVERLK